MQFWSQVQKEGRSISLISNVEAAKHGGKSAIPEAKAEKVSFFGRSEYTRLTWNRYSF
jgi:hypothetical protein